MCHTLLLVLGPSVVSVAAAFLYFDMKDTFRKLCGSFSAVCWRLRQETLPPASADVVSHAGKQVGGVMLA